MALQGWCVSLPEGTLSALALLQYNDNTWGSSGVPATPNELQLYLINLTGATIPAWRDMPFTVAVATLANPVAATA